MRKRYGRSFGKKRYGKKSKRKSSRVARIKKYGASRGGIRL